MKMGKPSISTIDIFPIHFAAYPILIYYVNLAKPRALAIFHLGSNSLLSYGNGLPLFICSNR